MKNLHKNILAILLGVSLFVAVDFLLALSGMPSLADRDTFVGFRGSIPWLVRDETWPGEGTLFRLNPAKEENFNSQTVLMPKPAGHLRLVVLGGSTTYGRPWLGKTAFSKWLRLLGNRLGDRPVIEEINAGGISYASYRVHRLMKELLDYDPDLFVIYAGHNEFLEERTFSALKSENPLMARLRELLHCSPTYSWLYRQVGHLKTKGANSNLLPAEVQDRLATVAGTDLYHRDERLRRNVIAQYRASLLAMVKLAREKGVGVVLCTLPSNLEGFSPFKSEHRKGLSRVALKVWESSFRTGLLAAGTGDLQGALAQYSKALKIDDTYASLHFAMGEALLGLGRSQEALRAFERAKEEDIVPLRALDEMNQIVREIADTEQVPLADVEAVFKRVATNGIPGNDLFADHVHPTIKGQQLIAWVVFDTMVKAGMVPVSLSKWQNSAVAMRTLLQQDLQSLDERYLALGYWGVGRVLFWAGKYGESQAAYRSAWLHLKDIPDIPLKLGFLALFRANGSEALKYLAIADAMEPGNLDVKVGLANAYSLLGEGQKALDLLQELPSEGDNSAGVQEARGRALIVLGRLGEATDALQRAAALAPEVSRYARMQAEVLRTRGEQHAAERAYRRFLELTRDPDPEATLQDWLDSRPAELEKVYR